MVVPRIARINAFTGYRNTVLCAFLDGPHARLIPTVDFAGKSYT